MKIKVANATLIQLDWLVAKCVGITQFGAPKGRSEAAEFLLMHDCDPELQFSTNWATGGPISERERIDSKWTGEEWIAGKLISWITGQTELDAKMRCYVISCLGEEAEIPDCLA